MVGYRPFSRCAQVVWCYWGKIEPFSATPTQYRLAGCDQSGKNPLKYSSNARWAIKTQTTGRTKNEIHPFYHWTFMTGAMEWADNEIHLFSHWPIMTRAMKGTGSEIHSFSHWAIMTGATERTDSLSRPIFTYSHLNKVVSLLITRFTVLR